MILMQTLLFGHVPVLSQMIEIHAGFLMMKRSVSVCMCIPFFNATLMNNLEL